MNKMIRNSRDDILARLKAATHGPLPVRPAMPPAPELSLNDDQLRECFVTRLKDQGGIPELVTGREALRSKLFDICRQEGIIRAMTAEDDLIAVLELKTRRAGTSPAFVTPSDYPDRDHYIRAVFDEVQAGITSADYAVAESGTLVLTHHAQQARLISLAPIIHIAVVPQERLVPTYDSAMENIFRGGRRPSQVTFITGPSMTADIQATPFKGMHGPQKLYVLLEV